MGAEIFKVYVSGTSPAVAFTKAVEAAQWEYGHGGYTGTIAEKHEFTAITDEIPKTNTLPNASEAGHYADALIHNSDARIDDKWGPAGCIEIESAMGTTEKHFLFFGWASA